MRGFIGILAVFVASAAGQSVIDYSKLPSCAQSCAILKQAESSCVPPAAPVTSQAIYQSCVCQSALLVSLHSSGAQCQQPQAQCSVDDASKISQYYTTLCNSPAPQAGPSSTLSTSTTTTASSATGTATGAAAGQQPKATQAQYSWWNGHWKWVLMVIIIFLAIVFFWVGGACLRRHIHKKHEAQRANMAARDAYSGPQTTRNPATPGSNQSVFTRDATPSSMTMSGGRGGMAMDGGVGGIAPPRAPPRERSNTLQSLRNANGSRTKLPEPVVWGPHQHQALARGPNSPGGSLPPSPTVPSPTYETPPNPIFRNHQAMNSEPRFAHYHNGGEHTRWGSPLHEPQAAEIVRPHTAGPRSRGKSPVSPVGLSPSVQPQSAQFFNAAGPSSGRKLTKTPH